MLLYLTIITASYIFLHTHGEKNTYIRQLLSVSESRSQSEYSDYTSTETVVLKFITGKEVR